MRHLPVYNPAKNYNGVSGTEINAFLFKLNMGQSLRQLAAAEQLEIMDKKIKLALYGEAR
jgi:hypothetical protein